MHHFCSVGFATTLDVKCTSLKYGDSRAGKYEEQPCSFEFIQRGISVWVNPAAAVAAAAAARLFRFFRV